ncbi:MAG TPA: GtrA family protein [Gaiellaceae bacterium]|nr:GtrA family protein [Gaiellaceae bacterium]
MQRASAAASPGLTVNRLFRALRHPGNWIQLLKFSVVGLSGYVVNLVVYSLLLDEAGLHYLAAGACSFVVAAANNYWWNRHWTFRRQRGDVYGQGIRFFIVSLIALGANLGILHLLITAGMGKIPAQAIAILLVMPLNFVGNKLWSFRR